jgi:hypothetical protein
MHAEQIRHYLSSRPFRPFNERPKNRAGRRQRRAAGETKLTRTEMIEQIIKEKMGHYDGTISKQ